MIDKITHISVGDKQYPMAFSLNVIEQIQEQYGSINVWMKVFDAKDVKIADVIQTFEFILNEGIDIENEEKGEKRAFLSHKQVGRLLTQLGLQNATEQIKNLFIDSTNNKKNE